MTGRCRPGSRVDGTRWGVSGSHPVPLPRSDGRVGERSADTAAGWSQPSGGSGTACRGAARPRRRQREARATRAATPGRTWR
ncbi:hypothetical protein KIL84_001889 [Mauremys mutica]|uniref:Uncharacterized protein n=1 Tax=Mauremys mutica TaxID=74926 RepID=A0A9D3XKS9_9SAUR|nr:hypothetical protein KIL84_001889 [Mauremys mutica]